MRIRDRSGFSLAELAIAMGLGLLALAATASLLVPVVRAGAAAQLGVTAELGTAAALGAVTSALRKATFVNSPEIAGVASGTLEGCFNAERRSGSEAPAAIDPAVPISGFAFCSADGALWLHYGGCPLSYVCGKSSGMVVAGIPHGSTQASASFLLEPLAPAIKAQVSVSAGEHKARASTTVALTQAAAPAR